MRTSLDPVLRRFVLHGCGPLRGGWHNRGPGLQYRNHLAMGHGQQSNVGELLGLGGPSIGYWLVCRGSLPQEPELVGRRDPGGGRYRQDGELDDNDHFPCCANCIWRAVANRRWVYRVNRPSENAR